MSFEISPKGQDYSLKISGVGYQTLSGNGIRDLLANLATNPRSVDIKGVQLFLRTDEKRDELKSVLSSVLSSSEAIPMDEIQNNDDAEQVDTWNIEEPSEFNEEEEE